MMLLDIAIAIALAWVISRSGIDDDETADFPEDDDEPTA